MDFTDLNNACPKDNYPLPRIDQLVDSIARLVAKIHGRVLRVQPN